MQPFVEKFRPKTIDEVVHQKEVVETLRNTIATGNLPHLLFYGPPGTGKTSTVLAVAKQLFGAENMSSRVLELNASDERGIEVVRKKIKTFASLAVAESAKLPPFKLIILDEADSMTADAQHALRRTMEVYTRVTRFCIICNYISRIIDPIASRCAKFRFRSLPADAMRERLAFIGGQEGVTLTDDTLTALVTVSGGDMRRAVMLLQTCSNFYGAELAAKDVLEASSTIPHSLVVSFYSACEQGRFDLMQQRAAELLQEGYPALTLIHQLSGHITSSCPAMTDVQKARICLKLSAADAALSAGSDELLQLLDVGGEMVRILGV